MGPMPTMRQSSASGSASLVLFIFGIALAAFCILLTVRIVNRRERWAKWTLAATLASPLLYIASFGPACWIVSHHGIRSQTILIAYRPVLHCMSARREVAEVAKWYSGLAARNGWMWIEVGRRDWTWDWFDENDIHSPKSRAIMRSLGVD